MRYLPPLATRDRVIDAVLVILCGIGQATSAAFAAFATRDAFAALHAGHGIGARTLMELGAAGLFAALCLFVAHRRAEAIGQSYANSLRQSLYRHIARLPKSRHEQRRVGALSLRFVGDLSAARLWFGSGLPNALTALVVLPGALVILFALDSSLAPAGVLPVVVSLIVMITLAWHLEQRHRVLRSRRAILAINMIERIAMSPELDLMGRTGKELRSLAERGESLRDDAVARRSRTASLQATLHAGMALAGLAVLFRAGQIEAAPGTAAASLAVLALLTLPLQNLTKAWDHYCAWRVARGKALNLLREPTINRKCKPKGKAVVVTVQGHINDRPIDMTFASGAISVVGGEHASTITRHIAALDCSKDLIVCFNETNTQPKTAYLGDRHIGLQGSLRRTATLLSRKRPDDEVITQALTAYGLGQLAHSGKGLDTRIAESGRNLSAEETLRLDLARAELGGANLLVVASVRWYAMSDRHNLLELFRKRCDATVIVASPRTDLTPAVAGGEPIT